MLKKKKKILIWAAVIVILVGGFLALRIHSWNQTYGLPREVIAGERMPNAEETIRLYFYYSNRHNRKGVEQLLTNSHNHIFSGHHLWDDLKIVRIEYDEKWDHAKEWGNAYEVIEYEVTFNEGFLRVSSEEKKSSDYDGFILIQQEKGRAWKIDSIGKA